MKIEELREVFSHDRYAYNTGCFIEEVGEGYSRCSVMLGEDHKNAMGGVMGAVYFTLADFAFAVASNQEKMNTMSVSSNISFLNACKGTKLIAEARCVKDGRTTCCYEIDISDDTGRKIALVVITGVHVG